ncbi:peptidyl-prolyl cis-trans isomerase [Deinococcus psychrotolerans]|uniref:peptidylprolyl isomerase n=1 Tax=Deinococcus psychrotolerans TaxID=2489213 RepID=A0A3G8Y9R7_9DEIO|nr:peptidyl-prolyl cis-trans isomerase [Deinococcus psychrotolerans]AZI42109.1 peptidyl-prolyl cis-trans isomerase [Deinococcus psychrotolerans]
MNKKVLTSVLLGFLAVLLVVGLVYQFTPNVGSLFGKQSSGTPAITVNGQTVTVEEIQALQRSNPVLSATTEGILGEDLKTVAVESRIENALLKAASSGENISRADVNEQVDKVRKGNNLTDNKAWVDRLAQIGFTDASYREEVQSGLAIQKKQKSIADAAPKATEAQIKQFYSLNKDQFRDEARIIGREIVVADKAKATALLAQLKGGSDFATLARENSTEFKDRGGALGPVTGDKPAAVTQVALPPEVSAAAFALTGGGLTDVISSGGKFYIVKVEEFVPAAAKSYESVKKQITDQVNRLLQTAAAEKWFDGLRKSAKIDYLLPAWKINNPTVATVGGQDIPYSDVLSGVVGNQQFASLLQQVPADQAGSMVNQFLKPGIAEQLIEQYAAPTIVADKKLDLVGSRANLAQQLALYGSKDASVTDQDVIKDYQQNVAKYTTKASATLSEAVFTDRAKALAFRQSFDGKNFVQAASKAGGTVSERGSVTAGDAALNPALSKAVFDTSSLRPAGEGSVSDVIENGKTYSVAYVTDLVRANIKPLKEVDAVIRSQLLAQKRAEAGQAYIKAQMKDIKVDNKLSAVLAAQEKRIAAAAPKPATPATPPVTTTPVTTPPTASGTEPAKTPATTTPAPDSTSTPTKP